MSLVAYQLLERIRKAGGEVRLGPDGRLQTRKAPTALNKELSRNYYRVQTWLAEQRASLAWEANGRNLDWWRNYTPVLGGTYVSLNGEPGPPPNFKLNGADPFDVLKELVRKSQRGEQLTMLILSKKVSLSTRVDEITRNHSRIGKFDLPGNLNWELVEDFAEGKYTTYRFQANDGHDKYQAEMTIKDLDYSGYGYPQTIDSDDAEKTFAAALASDDTK